jgi:hypothetical protein
MATTPFVAPITTTTFIIITTYYRCQFLQHCHSVFLAGAVVALKPLHHCHAVCLNVDELHFTQLQSQAAASLVDVGGSHLVELLRSLECVGVIVTTVLLLLLLFLVMLMMTVVMEGGGGIVSVLGSLIQRKKQNKIIIKTHTPNVYTCMPTVATAVS